MQERKDEKRNPDVLRLKRNLPRGIVKDLILREEVSLKRRHSDTPGLPGQRRVSQSGSDLRIPGPFWIRQRPDERKEVDVSGRKKIPSFSEAEEVIHGGPGAGKGKAVDRQNSLDLGARCRPSFNSRTPGPFRMNQRSEERREPDTNRRRKMEQRNELPDGEEEQARERQEAQNKRRNNKAADPKYFQPGPSHADPFWLMERQDERRDPDMDRKMKFRRQKIQAAEIIHGDDFRTRWDPPDEEPENFENNDEDDSEPFPFKRACKCGPAPPQSGPDKWMAEKDWGGWDDNTPSASSPRTKKEFNVPQDVEETIRQPPAARVSCAPQADVSKFDQPSAFMKKLYEKYPYLHQVLAETPPEELISRVFKDRFMSTYQVDYLHMGMGKTEGAGSQHRSGGGRAGPDGEPEPEVIPGCSYRSSQKGDFGRKKQEEKEPKEKEEEPLPQEDKDEPNVSEYMATISKLGHEIVQDQLYAVANKMKNMRNKKT